MKFKQLRGVLVAALVSLAAFAGSLTTAQADDKIPSIKGSWTGENLKLNERKGYTSVKKTIHITEQKDRRFHGYFDYVSGGVKTRKNFFGIIYPDNETLSWVAADSKGYVHGRIHSEDRVSVCYIETGPAATVGCADMKRVAKQAQK